MLFMRAYVRVCDHLQPLSCIELQLQCSRIMFTFMVFVKFCYSCGNGDCCPQLPSFLSIAYPRPFLWYYYQWFLSRYHFHYTMNGFPVSWLVALPVSDIVPLSPLYHTIIVLVPWYGTIKYQIALCTSTMT